MSTSLSSPNELHTAHETQPAAARSTSSSLFQVDSPTRDPGNRQAGPQAQLDGRLIERPVMYGSSSRCDRCASPQDFLRHDDGVQGYGKKMAPDGSTHQGPDAPLAHRRPGYPLSGCVPAEPDSVSPGMAIVPLAPTSFPASLDTVVMPQKIHPGSRAKPAARASAG
jgi:hypothetical protein